MRFQVKQLLLLALFIPSMVTGCAMRKAVPVGEIPPARAASSDQRAAAEAFVEGYVSEQGYSEITKGKELQRVLQTVDRLTATAGFPKNSFVVKLVDAGEEVNAMTAGGASIVVYRELLNRVRNDDELAVVISHEVGHVLAGHSEESEELQERAAGVSVGSSILGTLASVAASVAGIGGAGLIGDVTATATGAIGYGAFVGSFDRDQEYEADQVGLMLYAKAGYDPQIAVQFWERSEEVFGSASSQVGAFFSTHPAPTDRVSALQDALPIAQKYYEEAKAKALVVKAKAPKGKAKASQKAI